MIEQVVIRYVPKDATFLFADEINRALAFGGGDAFSIDDILKSLSSGEKTLLVAQDQNDKTLGCVVVEVVQWPRKKALLVFSLSGYDLPLWINPMEKFLSRWAREIGADDITAHTRPGLGRLLKHRGWEHEAELMRLKT